jgi:Na+/phosphate symporter
VSREDGLSETDAKRCSDILAFTINLEHVGDILDKSLREIAAKKIKQRLSFSQEGLQEIAGMHQSLLDDLRLATSVFMLGDQNSARMLLRPRTACATWNRRQPTTTCGGCARGARRASRPARCTSTSPAT